LEIARDIFSILTNSTEPVDVSVMEETFKNVTVFDLFKATLVNRDTTISTNGLVSRAVLQKAGKIKYLTRSPKEHLSKGDFRTLPMMAGVTKDEGTYFATLIYDKLEVYDLQDNDNILRNNMTTLALQNIGTK
jgi:carboxylesterase type B